MFIFIGGWNTCKWACAVQIHSRVKLYFNYNQNITYLFMYIQIEVYPLNQEI